MVADVEIYLDVADHGLFHRMDSGDVPLFDFFLRIACFCGFCGYMGTCVPRQSSSIHL